MPLTIPEKEHWLAQLRRLLDRKIAALRASDPTRLKRLEAQARQRAWQSLGLASLQAERESLTRQTRELRRRLRQVHRAMLATVRRLPLDEVPRPRARGLPQAVAEALQQRQAAHIDELLAEDPLGRELLRLRREQERCRTPSGWPGRPRSYGPCGSRCACSWAKSQRHCSARPWSRGRRLTPDPTAPLAELRLLVGQEALVPCGCESGVRPLGPAWSPRTTAYRVDRTAL